MLLKNSAQFKFTCICSSSFLSSYVLLKINAYITGMTMAIGSKFTPHVDRTASHDLA